MLRDIVQLHDAFVVEIGNGVETFDRGRTAARAGVDKELLRAQLPLPTAVQGDVNLPGTGEGSLAANQLYMRVFQTLFAAFAPALDDGSLSFPHTTHVDGDRADMYTVIGAATRQVGRTGAGHHGFGGRATAIDTSSAHILALDQRGLLSRCDQCPGQWITALSRADDDGVEDLRYLCAHGHYLEKWDASKGLDAIESGLALKLLSTRDEEETAADGKQIFEQGQHQIGRHRRQRAAVIVTGEGAGYPAHCTQQRARQRR